MDTSPEVITKEEGLRLLKAGQVVDAIKVFEQVRAKADDAQVCTYLGAAYSQNGDKAGAVEAFEESLRLSETPKAHFNLAVAYEAVGRIDEAMREYQKAIDLDPNYAPAQEALKRQEGQLVASPQVTQSMSTEPPPVSQTQSFAGPPPPGPAIDDAPEVLADPFAHQFAPPPTAEDLLAREMQKEQAVADQHHAMMKSGLIYGAICGAIFFVLANFASKVLAPTAIPLWAATGGGLFLYTLIVALVGAGYGALVGLWIGYTCGGESAGMQAGAVMGAVLGVLLGILSRQILMVIILMVGMALISGVVGMLIGRMVDMSISD